MTRFLTLFKQIDVIVIFFVLIIVNQVAYAGNEAWQLVKKSDGINVYKSLDKSTGLQKIKAQLIVHSTLSGFLLFLQDTDKIPSWLDNAFHSNVIKQVSINENIFITHFDGVWPVKPRNMVINSRYIQNEDLSIDIFVNDASSAIDAVDGEIRVTVLHAHWYITPVIKNDVYSGELEISHQFLINPNGSVPKWLTNQMTVTSMWTTLNNIRSQLPNSPWQEFKVVGIVEP